MASRAIIQTILERKLGYLAFAPRGTQLAAIIDDYVSEFRGTDAEILSAGVDQWFRNQPADRQIQALPMPSRIWPLINRDRTEQRVSPDNAAAKFVKMPDNVRAQMELLGTAWGSDSSDVRARAAETIRELATPLDSMEALTGTRACRCIGGWVYEGGQTYPTGGLLCDRRVYPCRVHNERAFATWLDSETEANDA